MFLFYLNPFICQERIKPFLPSESVSWVAVASPGESFSAFSASLLVCAAFDKRSRVLVGRVFGWLAVKSS